MHQHHRRRKKRPNYGTRTVEVSRGYNGFGFTISGQQPCILSCIVPNSPADQAGLRAGDFLISVNGSNVSKLPHESVVQLIGSSFGTIRMQIAENYFSDSSDEENVVNQVYRSKPSYLHHKLKMNRLRNSPQKGESSKLRPVIEDPPSAAASHNIIHSPNASTSKDISNVSAMVRSNETCGLEATVSLEYRAIVGYLGTIEMPKQIATSSKLQTVRSCIRKLRQEKRNPTTVLMTILPNCLTLRSSNATILATYPSSRLNYVSSSSESENRFFGLVTSAIYSEHDEDDSPDPAPGVIISNSCHVFVVDTKLYDHVVHESKASEFRITCTKDPISNLCLEFPNNSEYVVNLIRSMYTMRVLPPAHRQLGNFRQNDGAGDVQANSPQPSNHSEVTTTSSNSDSGIGFHNDCTNISDRILVVDFPGLDMLVNRPNPPAPNLRPLAVCNNFDEVNEDKKLTENVDTRLTVRAMPDPKTPPSVQAVSKIPDLLASFNLIKSPATSLVATRSCDDVLSLVDRRGYSRPIQLSMDDITMHQSEERLSHSCPKEHIFLPPNSKPNKKSNNQLSSDLYPGGEDPDMFNKLSPKVFAVPKPKSDRISRRSLVGPDTNSFPVEPHFDGWGSLQNIFKSGAFDDQPNCERMLEGAYSVPDLASRALPANGSPFRRLGQSSFRAPRSTETRSPLGRRPSSLVASDNDVYIKSMDLLIDEFRTTRSHGGNLDLPNGSSKPTVNELSGVVGWGKSFEKLLEDPAGLHTFAEFLKKEFSAENIYFWTACERYRQIDSDSDRASHAIDIFSKHLANGALEPVNVDSQARTLAEENLEAADRNLFSHSQKQIFNLMKFDSYQRFIRSDLYNKCVEAEEKKLPLPYPAEELDEMLKTSLHTPGPSKLKKSVSNAEDRRRKSLLPWHRKTRCKSRDRSESDVQGNKLGTLTKNHYAVNTLKPPITNSTSDLHSSRSSLSSFDTTSAVTLHSGSDDSKACSLCRVILNDGATTIVQIRTEETVRQLVDRLLEKRALNYAFFDIIFTGSNKSVDLESPSNILAGKEVQIEQRVAFKLDLPDPKVISVKSKPKKVLFEVIRPILQKYNYRMEDVQVLMRDTHEQLDLSLPVTMVDGQRLQIVMLKLEKNGFLPHPPKLTYTSVPAAKQNKAGATTAQAPNNPQQSTLDEITNKVFNELLQGKVENHNSQKIQPRNGDQCSLKSEDCASETSSIFDRLRRRDGLRSSRPKKVHDSNKATIIPQEDAASVPENNDGASNFTKKPLIAKWKTGVKVQVTERTDKQDEFIEGLKRAQRARLEDQRGLEINFELPDFLKDKENLSAANKLRKIRANLSPVSKPLQSEPDDIPNTERPQPAPRLSLTKSSSVSPMKVDSSPLQTSSSESIPPNMSHSSFEIENDSSLKGPPPLPPKPKVLPIKPSNWGQNSSSSSSNLSPISSMPSKIPIDVARRHLDPEPIPRNAYLDQPSSSFV